MRQEAPIVRRFMVALVLAAATTELASAQISLLPIPLFSNPLLSSPLSKLDPLTQARVSDLLGRSRVIVRVADAATPAIIAPLVARLGGLIVRTLPGINAQVVDLPNLAILTLAADPFVARVSLDRLAAGSMERTAATVGAAAVRQDLGYDGSGVGVAVIDSGITSWHDDLAAAGGGQRVDRFADFVNGWPIPYDDYGHGTHVAGIIAGDGFDSSSARAGIAPGVHLIVLKALDGSGRGYISDVIAALEYVVDNRTALNIRIVNLSIATGVYESFHTDPLTLAAKRVVDAGVVVIAASGNRGRNPNGHDAYGGITAPGNAPWVLTVGASSHMGTIARADDTMAAFSSRGPTAADSAAKPDLVAPGVGIESLSDPDSAFYDTKSSYLLAGTISRGYLPYLSLSGTSMSAPVVAGTVALMLEANPSLTPNAVKAILQFSAQSYAAYDPLTQGAGFLNAQGSVALARWFANLYGSTPDASSWSRRLLWGNRLITGAPLVPDADAWRRDVTWGATMTPEGRRIGWGGTSGNAVWGSACGGADCQGPWTVEAASTDDESVVWGTADAESVVWGTSADDESVVWGTSCSDQACVPVVWGRR
jgi:serine protease AprX